MPGVPEFRFLTNHGNALLLIVRDPKIADREIAALLDITEQAARRVVTDLSRAGYVDITKEGRRSIYAIKSDPSLRPTFQGDEDLRALLGLLRERND
jgi:hypothetical protein